MADQWAKIDWAPGTAITHTRLNDIGNSLRTWGYGETPGSVTVNANENHLANVGSLTMAADGDISNVGALTFGTDGYIDSAAMIRGASPRLRFKTTTDETDTFAIDFWMRADAVVPPKAGIIAKGLGLWGLSEVMICSRGTTDAVPYDESDAKIKVSPSGVRLNFGGTWYLLTREADGTVKAV